MTEYVRHYEWSEWADIALTPHRDIRKNPSWGQSDSYDKLAGGQADGWTWAQTVDRVRGAGYAEALPDVERIAGRIEQEIVENGLRTSFEARYDVAGAEVDMGRFLSGEPECMIESAPIRIAKRGRVVRIVVPGSFVAGTAPEYVRTRGAAVVALCDILARAQHPLEIWAAYCNGLYDKKSRMALLVKVQAADQPLDQGRIMLALAHPIANRRLCYSVKEQLPRREAQAVRAYAGGGYGLSGRDARPSDLPDDQGTQTILLPSFDRVTEWTPDLAVEWVQRTLEEIFAE